MKRIPPIKAWCVVNTEKPRIRVLEIYDTDDIKLLRGEKIIKILITEYIKFTAHGTPRSRTTGRTSGSSGKKTASRASTRRSQSKSSSGRPVSGTKK